MSLLHIYYYRMSPPDRRAARAKILELAGMPKNSSLIDVIGVNPRLRNAEPCADAEPFVAAAVLAWWERAGSEDMGWVIDDIGSEREKEVAILCCAEAAALVCDHQAVAECRETRLAWLRGASPDEARAAAMLSALRAAAEIDGRSIEDGYATRVASTECAVDAVWRATRSLEYRYPSPSPRAKRVKTEMRSGWGSFASPLRLLFPHPARLDWRDALTRWDAAVLEARDAMRALLEEP